MALHVQYLINKEGVIAIPPDEEAVALVKADERWAGYELREANTLREVDALQKTLFQQEVDRLEKEGIHEQTVWESRLKSTRDNLLTKARSSATTPYEKEFIYYWLQLRDEKRKAEFEKRFHCDKAFFEMREFDKPRNAEEIIGESL